MPWVVLCCAAQERCHDRPCDPHELRPMTRRDQDPVPAAQGGVLAAQSGVHQPRSDHPVPHVVGAFTPPGQPPDPVLVRRIRQAYRAAQGTWRGPGESLWAAIGARHRAIHDALLADDGSLDTILRDPGRSDLLYGFHSLFASRTDELRAASDGQRQAVVEALAREMLRLCEALGVRPLGDPEAPAGPADVPPADLEAVLSRLDDAFGIRVEFPNPYPDEFGVMTSRGIISYRAVHALYQTFRMRQLTRAHGPRILEIGAGLGRTAYYAYRLGLRDYTIVDLPMANVAQASFLGQTLGATAITLSAEAPNAGRIRILTPEWLRQSEEAFDVVLNVDSMTEMDRGFAEEYASYIQARATCFVSINRETNPFRVCELAGLGQMFVQRFPYWMRDGYAEEIYLNLPRRG